MNTKQESRYLLRIPQFLMNPVRKLSEQTQKSIKQLMREAVEEMLKKNNLLEDK